MLCCCQWSACYDYFLLSIKFYIVKCRYTAFHMLNNECNLHMLITSQRFKRITVPNVKNNSHSCFSFFIFRFLLDSFDLYRLSYFRYKSDSYLWKVDGIFDFLKKKGHIVLFFSKSTIICFWCCCNMLFHFWRHS